MPIIPDFVRYCHYDKWDKIYYSIIKEIVKNKQKLDKIEFATWLVKWLYEYYKDPRTTEITLYIIGGEWYTDIQPLLLVNSQSYVTISPKEQIVKCVAEKYNLKYSICVNNSFYLMEH